MKIKKMNILRIILILLLLCTFFVIFGFSSQDGEVSGGISQRITKTILEKSNRYNNLPEKRQNEISHRTEKIIRKMAHFSIYTVVGLLLMGLFSTYHLKNNWRVIMTIVIGILYAGSDEFHQSFSPGRTPKVTDVYIDTLGVLLGILLVLFVKKLYYKRITK